MRTKVCLLTLLGCIWATPSTIDWSKVKRVESFAQPLPGAQPRDVNVRVIGGEDATPHSIPYQVAVIASGGLCGGSLISPEWVLSAAHCTIESSSAEVILGAHNIRLVEPTQVVVVSNDITNHPDYSISDFANDISLIRLPFKVNLTSTIQVIGLAALDSGDFAGDSALLSGWGRTSDNVWVASDILQKINLTVITNTECQGAYGSIVQPSILCTSGEGGIGSCTGDSGGPLVVENTQVGVVSFGAARCEGGFPSGYTRVSSFRAWTENVTGI